VLQAALLAAHASLHLLRPGVKNTQLTGVVEKIATQFGVETVKKHTSFQCKRLVVVDCFFV
jgi:hypothetical protein